MHQTICLDWSPHIQTHTHVYMQYIQLSHTWWIWPLDSWMFIWDTLKILVYHFQAAWIHIPPRYWCISSMHIHVNILHPCWLVPTVATCPAIICSVVPWWYYCLLYLWLDILLYPSVRYQLHVWVNSAPHPHAHTIQLADIKHNQF